MYFIDKVEADVFVDYGCADGTLFKFMKPFVPDAKMIGFDSDPTMIRQAHSIENTEYLTNWNDTKAALRLYENGQNIKSCLILSSVIHEVYHYSQVNDIAKFWDQVFNSYFDYIAIRDMIPSESIDRQSDINDVANVYRKYRGSKELKDFERLWGSIENNKNLTHFLLKYKYLTPNWEREVKENYFPMYREDLLSMIPTNYQIDYHEHFTLPYIKTEVHNDLNIILKDATHLKLILKRK